MSATPYMLFAVLLLLWLPVSGHAQESRLALVIGNSNYVESPLKNPINDAVDMASVLEDLGFTVILSTDADRREMGRAIRQFGRQLKERRGVGLFYYAGHGMQIDNRNFLIPVGTPLAEEDEVPFESIDVGSVLAKMESAGNSLNLIILDACRNNPFPRRFRSSNRGLARVEAPIGSLVVYATAPGAVAADGTGRNGVFTGALLKQLRTDGLSLTQTIRQTRAEVVKATNGQQVPWESSSLLQDYYFTKPAVQLVTNSNAGATTLDPAMASNDESDEDATENRTESLLPEEEPAELTQEDGNGADNAQLTDSQSLAMLDTSQESKPLPESNDAQEPDGIAAPDPDPIATKPAEPTMKASLSVDVDPPDARVRIMNIVEKYKDGITLDTDRQYDLYITRKGYHAYREMISLNSDINALNITLEKQGIIEPDMIAIAGGRFTMGCSAGDHQCEAYEKPSRSITINPYSIATTEVTVEQFEIFVSATGYVTDAEKNAGGNAGCFTWQEKGGISRSQASWTWDENSTWRNPGFRQTPQHPVTCVSWNDAKRYAAWMASETGRAYALPSEAEWELAARANTSSPYGQASSARGLCAIANVADRTEASSGAKWSSRVECTDGVWFTAPVASYQPNAFGLFDMQGNTWEWVADTWADDLSKTPLDGSANTQGINSGRVLRGGGWDSDATRARLSSRSRGGANGRATMTGFRLVLR